MALWTPAEISTLAWFDAADESTITIATGISQWADKSGNARHFAQATGANQPSLSTLGWIDVAVFDGSNDGMSATFPLIGPPLTVFMVAAFNNPSASDFLYLYGNLWADGRQFNLWRVSDSRIAFYHRPSEYYGPTAPSALSLFRQDFNSSSPYLSVLINGSQVTHDVPPKINTLVNNTCFLGYTGDVNYPHYFGGAVAEIIFVSGTIDTATKQKIEGYLAWKNGLQASLPSDHPYKSAAPSTGGTFLSAYLSQPYALLGEPVQISLDQSYAISADIGTSLEQLYSMVLEIWLTQHYGDVPLIGKALVQPYGNGSVLIKSLQQRWDHAPELEVSLEQPWSLPDLLQAVSVQSYGIVAEVLHLTCEQLYHINEHSTLFASLLQPYIIAEETARLYQFDTRLYINGDRIPYHALEWQAVDSEFVWSCDFSVKTREVAVRCVDGAEIMIVSAGDTWRLKCYDGWFLDKRFQSTVYRISGRSKSFDLSLATPLLGDIAGGMASEIVAALAAPHGISVDWQMVDGYIADGRITANDQTPIEIIKDIVHDAGGIVLSTLDGNLLIVAEEETPVPDWPAATPAQTIHAVLERISTSESKDEQKGYNCFDISDQLASGDTFRFEEEWIDGRTKELRLFLVPLDPERKFDITHSSDNQVTVEPFGIVSLQIDDELVEFKEGSGQTVKPVYGLSCVVWQKENLGGVAFSEDGILTSAVPGYSLLKVSYVTRFFKWIARCPRIDAVQFRAVKVPA